jgi:hypothetical protein
VNVTFLVPNDPGFLVIHTSDPPQARPPNGGPVLKLHRVLSDASGLRESWVHLDANTGDVLRQDIREEDRDAIQAVLTTLIVSPLDISTAKWPYAAVLPPDFARETYGGMSFVRPARDTGLLVGGIRGDPGGPGLSISNGRSGLAVARDRATGELIMDTEFLLPEDETVFMRWVDSVRICGSEIQC